MFLVREKIFDYNNNKYYKPNSTFNVNAANASIAMPNCTMYCMLRGWEAMEATKRTTGIAIEGSTGFHNAKYWFTETGYPTGSEIRDGAIAVFDGNCGHVAFVERKIDSTHAVISESNYDANKNLRNWKFWRSREVELKVGKATLSGVGKLLGFIYLDVDDKRVCRDTSVDQVEITKTLVNVRQGAGLDKAYVCQGLYCPVGIYNVLSWKTCDGYTWAKLDNNCWVACGNSWSKIYEKDATSKKELKAKLAELQTKKANLEAELKSVNAEIKKIEAKL